MKVRAEHPSVEAYLERALPPDARGNVLFVSYTQWGFALAALADIAATLHRLGAGLTLAFWTAHTPLRDTGWSASHLLGRLAGSPTRDQLVLQALLRLGVPSSSVVRPPLRHWRPSEPIHVTGPMNRSAIRGLTYHGSPMGRAILNVLPETLTPTTDSFYWPKRWVRTCARSYAWSYDQTAALIREQGVTAIVVYNGRFLHDRAASAAAQDAGIPVLYYDTGGLDTDYDLTDSVTHDWRDLQRRMLAMYDAWPADERDALGSSWFEERRRHVAPDNSLFTEAQEIGVTIERPDADRVVVYFSSSGDEIAELELDWGRFIGDQPEALRQVAEECRRRPGHALIVRSHPHKRMKPAQDVAEWFEAVEAAQPDLHLDPHSPVDSYALMAVADIVVTYGSTTGVEAAYAGRKVVVMGPSAYDELGCAEFAGTRAELAAALDSATPGSWPGAVSYGLMMRRRGFLLETVEHDPVDGYRLAGVPFADTRPFVLHVSDAFARLQRWYLRR